MSGVQDISRFYNTGNTCVRITCNCGRVVPCVYTLAVTQLVLCMDLLHCTDWCTYIHIIYMSLHAQQQTEVFSIDTEWQGVPGEVNDCTEQEIGVVHGQQASAHLHVCVCVCVPCTCRWW